jgi:glutamate synthase domain-containing protein 2/glutamate synthase domain-containing protein 1/glutamate synthase domain-containing protein 3
MRRSDKRNKPELGQVAHHGLPDRQGLYHPRYEHDACGTGFVAHVKGRASHTIVLDALTVLENLSHRGAHGSEPNTGDGAGILLQLPHHFFREASRRAGFDLPPPGAYGVGMLFLPQDPVRRDACEAAFEAIIAAEGQHVLGWRDVPTNNLDLGEAAQMSEPAMRQVFIGRGAGIADPLTFERKLYVIRRLAEKQINCDSAPGSGAFYIASLSARTVVYKGMLLSEQVRAYFPDLSNPWVESAIALVHSRFSTNTFPSWHRAHPYRYVTHNGEINTVKGNVNFMHARQTLFRTDVFGPNLGRLFPIVDEDGSDTAMLDNTLEFLTLAGRSLPHVVMMMIPEPWEKHEEMSAEKRAFYAYHSTLMEPWDGPASMAFTDGTVIGATLDRNGLRPSRYYVTTDDRVIMASEVGVLDIPPEQILYKGRLQPGRMFLVDTAAGRIIDDAELKRQMATDHPYREWLEHHMRNLADLPPAEKEITPDHDTVVQRQQAFGYTFEDLRLILAPMAKNGVEPLGSMGDDTPVAVLSARPQLLYNYFRQLFAQVTNPPIDAIREELITSSTILLGAEGDLLNPRPEDCRRIRIPSPLLSNADLAKLREIRDPGFQATTLPILFPSGSDGKSLEAALEDLFAAADTAITAGHNLLILSDRAVSREQAPIPALLAVSGLHQYLIRQGTRSRVSLLIESGEPREIHHFACLIGFGAEAINPYLAFETIHDLIQCRLVTGIDYEDAVGKYLKACTKGVIKVLSKMGISTVQSYHAAQIFEALGLSRSVVDRYFTGTPTRIEGADLDVIADEARERHTAAFPERPANGHTLDVGGRYQYREGGEYHLFNPSTIHRLQHAVRTGDYQAYKLYAAEVHDRETQLATLRSLLELKFNGSPLPLEEVESVEAIMRRFKTGAMSYGSISKEAHETLAVAMNRVGGKSNTGEGGEDPARYTPDENGDSRNSAIKQVASGRFGVTMEYLTQAQEIQIKMAQGAKPGEGGQLPGHKVYPWIASVRYSTPGVGLISPPPHHDIYSIEDLAQLIYDLKSANPAARINVKLVSEVGVGTIAAGVAKGHADVILISGHDGGTGASPVSSIKHAGLPWELGLAETHQTLVLNDLRSRVRLETDGQLKTGRDVVIAALLGAEEFGFATTPLVAMGCIMMRVCHLDTCPVGIATQNPELRRRFTGKPEHVANFMRFIAQEVRELMAALGARTMEELVGRTDLLAVREDIAHRKARQLDLSPLLYRPEAGPEVGRFCTTSQDHGLESSLDQTVLLDLCRSAIEHGEPVEATIPIRNVHRTVGTTLGSEIVRRHGAAGLPEDTIRLTFQGSAGQSFAAFLPGGLTFTLEGDANDYIGKGLSGGKIIVKPPDGSIFLPEENIIIGNVAFYGATGGEAYIRGAAGERFCVRNSGVTAVVEAVGDHGCEYMTGGQVVVLGSTGRNFAAGMSGGVAYVFDGDESFSGRCNPDMVDLVPPDEADVRELNNLIWQHAIQTGSTLAWHMLSDWDTTWPSFIKVLPKDYGRMLHALAEAKAKGLTGDEAVMVAFDANRRDLARVGGN